ncbi:hypothetical protein BC830DRAFT_1091633 [Chytriomyces sp. MP71]|nr:hypothetical protein BC830DRAFT_1091633 [Chytriomyces sp. MP71]
MSLVDKFGNREQLEGLSTDMVVKRHLAPLTRHTGLSLVQQYASSSSLAERNICKDAQYFVSHAYKAPFLALVDSVENFLLVQGVSLDTPIWIDFLSVSLHSTGVKSVEWWDTSFIKGIQAIGNLVLVLDSFSNPTSLSRAWCLYEMYACHAASANFHVALPPSQVSLFTQSLCLDPSRFYQLLTDRTNAETADTSKRSDKSSILDTLKKTCGFVKLVSIVRDTLFGSWIVSQCKFRIMHAKDEIDYCDWKSCLATWYFLQKDYALVEPFYLECLKLRKRLMGADAALRGTLNLALLYQAQERFSEAEPLFMEILSVRRTSLGDEHPDTVLALEHLAGLYEVWEDRVGEAEPLYAQVLASCIKANGQQHERTFECWNNLARLYTNDGNRDGEAESFYKASLHGRRELLGSVHPDTLQTMLDLANLLRAQGRNAEAEQFCLECLEARRKLLGSEHLETLKAVNCLAEVYYAENRFKDAEPLYTQYARYLKQNLTDKHAAELLQPLSNLGICCARIGLFEKAESNYLELVESSKKILGEEDPYTLIYMMGLAEVYKMKGANDKARPLLLTCLEVGERVLGKDDVYYQLFLKSLVDC